jgi:hypothetical protein
MEVHRVKKGKRHLLNEATPWLGRKVNVGGSTGGGDTKDEAAAAAETKEENPGFGSSNTLIDRHHYFPYDEHKLTPTHPAAQLNYKLCEKNYICWRLVIKWNQRQHVST